MVIDGLYVESWGADDAPALLYLHGGPGQSFYEFAHHQSALLSARLRVVAMDQRGVLRSDALPAGGTLTLAELVADCETVRAHLGIDSWAVLGQSFGGMIALLYAVQHPETVTGVIFENPAWDLGRTCRSLVEAFLAHPTAAAHPEIVDKIKTVLATEPDASTLTHLMVETVTGWGDDRDEIYVPDLRARREINELLAAAPFTPEQWGRGDEHLTQLAQDPDLYAPHTPLFAQLTQPTLLIKGGADPIPSAGEVADFVEALPSAELRVFEGAGHFVQAEQPQAYAELVTDFVLRS
jgi:proline iminopeptidase